MIFSGIRLPDELSIALEEDRLVVFAGAGISVPSPSNLPLFNSLARQINSGNPVASGQEDRFLGKLAREGTDVHAAAARLLCHENTRPTKLHLDILRLFGKPEKVRLVTTNFDNHFTDAANKLFGKSQLRTAYAPALPLGDDFTGLVYIHGSAHFDARALVLTDKDFGAAYLTRGWARDFLVPLFSKYVILFVGYSHSDVTTTYLARGLNQAEIKPRWTMVPSDTSEQGRENWAHLEISIAEYPVDPTNATNGHQSLTDFFTQWADHSKQSPRTKAKRAKAIARGLPPEADAISEYIRHCLNHPMITEDFCSAIRHPAWIGWMSDKGYLESVLAATDTASTQNAAVPRVIAAWLCSFVRRKFPEILLDLIGRRQRLNRMFTQMLAHTLWVEHQKVSDRHFAKWISILISQGKDSVQGPFWGYLLAECRLPDHLGVALCILEFLTTPTVRASKTLGFSSSFEAKLNKRSKPDRIKIEFSVEWPTASAHSLDKIWRNAFQPHLSTVSAPLARLAEKQLSDAHLLLRDVGQSNERFDTMSLSRSSIAPHGQDHLRGEECLSFLVDILREIANHWIAHDPSHAKRAVDSWVSTQIPLLKRIAAYTISIDPQYGSDERLDWLLTRDLIYRSGMKKEVFDILMSAYPQASPTARLRLLRRIDKGDRAHGYRRLGSRTRAYEKFNLLVWLRRADPACAMVSAAIERIRKTHSEFTEREHPEFDVWFGGAHFVNPADGVDFDKIVDRSPKHYIDELQSAHDRWDYYDNFSALFSKDRNWGRQFAISLADEPVVEADVWNAVFTAWTKIIHTEDDWQWILNLAQVLPHKKEIYSGIAYLVSHGVFRGDTVLSETTIDRAAEFVDRAWTLWSADSEMPDKIYKDWLTSAINHVGGWISEFWVHYCSNLRNRESMKWTGIPDSLRSQIAEAINGTNRVKVHARIALTPWISYLFVWDKEFASTSLLPLLDWGRDSVVAQQTWSVLLTYKRGNFQEFEKELIPFYQKLAESGVSALKGTTDQSEQFDTHALRSLGHNLAGLAMQIIPDPVESGFFRDFLPALPTEVRDALADGMERFLENSGRERQEKLWYDWIERYVDLRLLGVPIALSVSETKYMLEWCLHVGGAFPNAVDRITRMPLKGVPAYNIFDDLLTSEALVNFPLHACRLVVATLKAEEYPLLHESLILLHEKLQKLVRGTDELTSFEDLLYTRGWREQ